MKFHTFLKSFVRLKNQNDCSDQRLREDEKHLIRRHLLLRVLMDTMFDLHIKARQSDGK